MDAYQLRLSHPEVIKAFTQHAERPHLIIVRASCLLSVGSSSGFVQIFHSKIYELFTNFQGRIFHN